MALINVLNAAKKYKFSLVNIILILLIVCENLLLFYLHKYYITTQSFNAKCLFLSSIFFGLVLLCKFYKTDVNDAYKDKKLTRKNYISLLFFVCVLTSGTVIYVLLMKQHPISFHDSDILPFIQLFCQRFLNGQNVYAPINSFGYHWVPAGYLPFHWLPFTVAEALHFDCRYVSYAVWCLGSLAVFARAVKAVNSIVLQLLLAVFVPITFFFMYQYNFGILIMTIELLIAGYYILLITGISQNNVVLKGLVVSFCLLSRYSLILWLPLAGFTLFVSGRKKELYRTAGIVLLAVFLFCYLPFLRKDPLIFYTSYDYYKVPTLWEWKHLNDINYPMQLYAGCGFAYIFYYKLAALPLEQRIEILHKVHLILCLSVTVIMGAWYWFNKNRIHYKIFLMGSFKIYISVFLAFIQIPYPYLMIVGNFVSVAIFCEQLRYRVKLNTKSNITTVPTPA
jgi:hypothetical protein